MAVHSSVAVHANDVPFGEEDTDVIATPAPPITDCEGFPIDRLVPDTIVTGAVDGLTVGELEGMGLVDWAEMG